jgi:hypothetical protein
MQNKLMVMIMAIIVNLLFIKSAYAYLDPGTGSILLQGLIAAVAGVTITGKLYWSRLKDMFSRKTKKHREPPEED